MGRIAFLFIIGLSVCLLSACREQSKEDLLQQGMAFVEADKSQAAVNLFRQALEKDPNYIEARLQLGLAYLNTNKLDKAESELQKVFRQKPQDPEISLRLAELYLVTDRPEQAITQLQDFPKNTANHPEALHFLARAHAMKGDFETAEELFHASLRARPDDVRTQLGLARLLYGADRFEEGTRLVNQVIAAHPRETDAYYLLLRKSLSERNRPEAIRVLEEIRAIDPDDVYAAYLLGMLFLDAGSLDSAREIADELLTGRPEHPAGYRIKGVALYQAGDADGAVQNLQKSLTGMQDMAGFYFLGLAHYRQGQYELAISSFQKALDEVPEHELSRLMIAQTFLKQGRIEDGVRQAKFILAQNPANARAHNVLGSAYMLQGAYDLAMVQIEKALQLEPELAQAHLNKGLFNLATGQKGQGEIDLARAVDAAPEILNTRLLLASHYLRMHNYPEALDLLKEGLAISADNAVIYNFLAAAQFGQNQPEEAVQSLQKAKSLEKKFFAPYFNLAKFYISRKDYEAALAEYEGVLQVDPQHLKALLRAAALQEFLGRNPQAEAYYQRAVETNSPEGYLALAGFWKRNDGAENFLPTLEAGCRAFPEHPELLIAFGQGLRAAGRDREAIEAFVTLDELRPGMGKPYLLGIHLGRGDVAAAREIAERAIAENRQSPAGYLFQATIHETLAEWSQAEQTLREGLAATGGDTSLKMYLAGFYGKRGSYGKAQDIYAALLREKPDWPPALFGKAAVFDASGNKKQAQDLYEQVLTIDEDYVPALNNLAYLFLEVYADYQRAYELAARGFRLKPNDPRIIDTLGYALLKNGQAEKSILFLEKAARLLPAEPAIQLHLAEAYKAAGRTEEAVASLTAIKGMKVPDAQRQKAETLLEGLN